MELLIKKRIIKTFNITISYSATILWLLFYDFICDYLNSKGINCKSGIALGLLQQGLRNIIIALSLVINLINLKRIKISILFIYFIFSSYFLFPENPYRWVYFSMGSTIFMYVLDNFISLLKIKNNVKESFLNFVLLIIICLLFIFFCNGMLKQLLLFFLEYLVLGNFIIIVGLVMFYLLLGKTAS